MTPLDARVLQRIFGLPERADVPVLGFIGRLDDQKGADIILEALPWLCQQDVQVRITLVW